jgi:hypothetical protein
MQKKLLIKLKDQGEVCLQDIEDHIHHIQSFFDCEMRLQFDNVIKKRASAMPANLLNRLPKLKTQETGISMLSVDVETVVDFPQQGIIPKDSSI